MASGGWCLLAVGVACAVVPPRVCGAGIDHSAQLPVDWPLGPLRVQNMSPVAQLYGLPLSVSAHILDAGFESSLSFAAVSNFQIRDTPQTAVYLDGETHIARLDLRGALAPGWEWGVTVPYLRHAGGQLDTLIDNFHSLFGLPDGGRAAQPRHQLRYRLQVDDAVAVDIDHGTGGLGDVRLFAGYQVMQDPRRALAVRAQIKLPTGQVDRLTGSRAVDVAVATAYERALWDSRCRCALSAGLGVTYLGAGRLLPTRQRRWAGTAHVGLQFRLHPRLQLHAQVDGHTTLLDTGNPLLAEGGLLGTLGGRIGLSPRWWLDLAVIEDLHHEAAADVALQLTLGARL